MKKYLLFIVILFVSCNRETRHVRVDSSIDTVFKGGIFILKGLNKGISLTDITFQEYLSDTIYYSVQNNDDANAYIEGNKLIIVIRIRDGLILIEKINNSYNIDVEYYTDIGGTYPEGNKWGTDFTADLVISRLIFRNNNFEIGDTIHGYFDIRTEPFKYFGGGLRKYTMRTDHYFGAFVLRILNKEEYESNPDNIYYVP